MVHGVCVTGGTAGWSSRDLEATGGPGVHVTCTGEPAISTPLSLTRTTCSPRMCGSYTASYSPMPPFCLSGSSMCSRRMTSSEPSKSGHSSVAISEPLGASVALLYWSRSCALTVNLSPATRLPCWAASSPSRTDALAWALPSATCSAKGAPGSFWRSWLSIATAASASDSMPPGMHHTLSSKSPASLATYRSSYSSPIQSPSKAMSRPGLSKRSFLRGAFESSALSSAVTADVRSPGSRLAFLSFLIFSGCAGSAGSIASPKAMLGNGRAGLRYLSRSRTRTIACLPAIAFCSPRPITSHADTSGFAAVISRCAGEPMTCSPSMVTFIV